MMALKKVVLTKRQLNMMKDFVSFMDRQANVREWEYFLATQGDDFEELIELIKQASEITVSIKPKRQWKNCLCRECGKSCSRLKGLCRNCFDRGGLKWREKIRGKGFVLRNYKNRGLVLKKLSKKR